MIVNHSVLVMWPAVVVSDWTASPPVPAEEGWKTHWYLMKWSNYDPKLSNRYDTHGIRPIVIDPTLRWKVENSTVIKLASQSSSSTTLAPWIIAHRDQINSTRQEIVSKAAEGWKLPSDSPLTHPVCLWACPCIPPVDLQQSRPELWLIPIATITSCSRSWIPCCTLEHIWWRAAAIQRRHWPCGAPAAPGLWRPPATGPLCGYVQPGNDAGWLFYG